MHTYTAMTMMSSCALVHVHYCNVCNAWVAKQLQIAFADNAVSIDAMNVGSTNYEFVSVPCRMPPTQQHYLCGSHFLRSHRRTLLQRSKKRAYQEQDATGRLKRKKQLMFTTLKSIIIKSRMQPSLVPRPPTRPGNEARCNKEPKEEEAVNVYYTQRCDAIINRRMKSRLKSSCLHRTG